MANFKKNTRYTNGKIDKNRSNQDFLILRPKLNLLPASGDVFVTITADIANRPDLISFKAYGVVELWWAIYELNNIRDPLFDLQIGQIIRLPAVGRLTAAISMLGKS